MSDVTRRRFLVGGLASSAAAASTDAAPGPAGHGYLDFRGPHQTGITHPANEQGLLAAFTVTAADRDDDGILGEGLFA